jgi:hypothetical protein
VPITVGVVEHATVKVLNGIIRWYPLYRREEGGDYFGFKGFEGVLDAAPHGVYVVDLGSGSAGCRHQ